MKKLNYETDSLTDSFAKQNWTVDLPDSDAMFEDLDDDILELTEEAEIDYLDLMPESVFNLYYGGVNHA